MSEPDLRDPLLRVLTCRACGEPVWGSPIGRRLTLACGYCGHADVRELAPDTAPARTDEAYRGARSASQSRPLRVDFVTQPPGFPKRGSVADLRAVLAREEKKLAEHDDQADDMRSELEFRVAFGAGVLAMMHLQKHDRVRARAVLESGLERQREPLYRAFLLARLARLAAFGDAPELAERWLSAISPDLRVPEVATDIRTVRAALLRTTNPQGALDVLGSEDADVGASRNLAMALRVDALERLGKLSESRRAHRRGSRGNAMRFQSTIRAFELAPATQRRTILVGWAALALIAFVLSAFVFIARGELLPAVAVVLAGLVATIVLKRF